MPFTMGCYNGDQSLGWQTAHHEVPRLTPGAHSFYHSIIVLK
jgi:hypothetical protein